MAVLVPIAPPKSLYIVHKNGNPLVWPVKDTSHAIVSFSTFKTAATVAVLTESHYLTHKEWPRGGTTFSFKDEVIPTILEIQEVDFTEMSTVCSLWDLHLLIIDAIKKNKYDGELRSFDIDPESRVAHLNSLWYPST